MKFSVWRLLCLHLPEEKTAPKQFFQKASMYLLAMHSLFEGGSTEKCKSIQGSQKLPGIIDFWRWISKTSLCKRWGMGVWHCFVPNIPKMQSPLYLLLMAEILRSPVEVGIVYPRIYRVKKHPNGGWEWGFQPSTLNLQQRASCHYQGATLCQRKSKGDEELWNLQYLKPDLGVSKNRGTSKWMVYNGKPY